MKKILFVILFSWVTLALCAQSNSLTDERRKEFEAQKVAFFTQELELSPEEAAVFWPLYNEMRRKYREVETVMKGECKRIRESEKLQESDYETAIHFMLAQEQKLRDIKKEYYGKLMKVVPASKIWRLERAEHKFHRQLFEKLRRECASRK